MKKEIKNLKKKNKIQKLVGSDQNNILHLVFFFSFYSQTRDFICALTINTSLCSHFVPQTFLKPKITIFNFFV